MLLPTNLVKPVTPAVSLKQRLFIMAKVSERYGKGRVYPKKQFLFLPFNPSNRHWTLLFFNLKTSTLYILDPLKQHTDADLASIITNIILEKTFCYSKGFTIGSMSQF